MPEFDADHMLEEALKKHGNILGILVAETAIWANPAVHHRLIQQTGNAAKYPHIRRASGKGEKRGQDINGIRLDDNTYANNAIKWAIGGRAQVKGYAVCHIWDTKSEKDHTVIANLVLVPRALAGITDHHAPTKRMLQYRAYELYGWHPAGQKCPVMPDPYVSCWREPELDRLDRSRQRRLSHDPLRTDGTNQSLEEKIRRWSQSPQSNVHKIISMAVQKGALPFDEFVVLIEGFSKNPSGALHSLMTDAGNAYGSVFVMDGPRNISIKPEVKSVIERYTWEKWEG